ncbi:sulfatase-like hydrolase/transferase [Viridibacillus sp. YIM B01967]|uniref:Sulfatase-like hydrolase/transferase n=1 Tax=Viridibacillus soli TaxID=2798301 RepID=A0ABS1H625_9BACL|nr:sulfatase-like hydrolase/transferase [Viridibacillus soli]MBK3494846.1 sulfatase-like hydrolase/transferase [Viridibacillus soli]
MSKQQKESVFVKEIIALHNHIENCMTHLEFEEALTAITRLGEICKTEIYYISLSTLYFNNEKINEVKEVVDEGLFEYPFSYSLHFNGSIAEYLLGQYDKSFYHVGKCLRYAGNSEQEEAAKGNLNGLIDGVQQQNKISMEELKVQLLKVKKIANEEDQRSYPINQYGESMIRKVRKQKIDSEVMTNMYKSCFLDDVEGTTRFLCKSELLKGKACTSKHFFFEDRTALPVSFIDDVTDISIKYNETLLKYQKGTLDYKQFNYLTFDKGEVAIKSEDPIFIGTPIPLIEEKKPYRLVLHLFVDAISQKYLEDVGLENAMPNTYTFFKEGYMNKNAYATAEWTLPSLASVSTGKNAVEHGLYHPNYAYDLSKKNKLLLTNIKEAGYYTAHFNNDWRSVPNYGYDQAFDRVVYQNAMGGYEASEIIGEAIEHIETYKNKNNYVWLTLTDLHDVPDEIHKNLMGQVLLDAKYRTKKEIGITSVRTSYDENKTERYYHELKRLDTHLATLYGYIQATYDKEEVLIVLNSDHGQSFLAESPYHFMHEYRRKVPLMIFGGGISAMVSNELTSGVDIYPTLLNILDIELDSCQDVDGQIMKDFGGKEREFALTESYHPDQTYKAVIETNEFTIYYETNDEVDNQGKVDMLQYSVDIEIKGMERNVEQLHEKISYYEDYIIRKRAVLQR